MTTEFYRRDEGQGEASAGDRIGWPSSRESRLRDKGLLTTAMRARMSLARRQARSMPGAANIIEVDVELNAAEQKRVALDKAVPGTTHVLETLAKEAFERFCADHPLDKSRHMAGH